MSEVSEAMSVLPVERRSTVVRGVFHDPARPILITGSHRSGTSWVGRMLTGSSTPVACIFEPFSTLHRPGICAAPFPYWFPYICAENEAGTRESVADTLAFHYRTFEELRAMRSAKDAARLGRDRARFHRSRRIGARPLLKDPIAVFSAEWLCNTFGMDVVVTIRHPITFAGSLKRLGWTHPFSDFLKQPLLMRDHLEEFTDEIEWFARNERPIVEQAALLWKLIHHTILGYRDRHPTWQFLRLEDLARDPVPAFSGVYAALGMNFDQQARALVLGYNSAANPADVPGPRTVKRDSKGAMAVARTRLTEHEGRFVREQVGDLVTEFYAEDDW